MTYFLIYTPFLISFLTGLGFIYSLKSPKTDLPFILSTFLGWGFGLALNAGVTFLSFVFFNQFNRPFVIGINIALCIFLSISAIIRNRKEIIACRPFTKKHVPTYLALLAITLFSIPLFNHAHFYAYGGWDAWSTWNLKAKFLFLGGENWRNMFDPILWRSSPHYPLLLPLINVWGWSFINETHFNVPIFTSFSLTYCTVGLLCFSLKKFTQSNYSFLPALVFFTLPYFVKIAFSQYCDGVLGFYLLAAVILLIFAKQTSKPFFLFLVGIAIGIISFAKGEGLIASFLLTGTTFVYMFWKNKPSSKKSLFGCFVAGIVLGSIPSLIYFIFYAPDSLTFINGLQSTIRPSHLFRLKLTLSFYLMELVGPNWNGLWILLIFSLIFSGKKPYNKYLVHIPVILIAYMSIITMYYFVNTYFYRGQPRDMAWWLQVSLHRIIYALLPTLTFWAFSSVWQKKDLQ